MACLVCDHPKRHRIESAIGKGISKSKVAKDFGISRTRLQDHIKLNHNATNPAKETEESSKDDEVADPFPNDYSIREMRTREERVKLVERMIEDRQFYGSETVAKLARIWRDALGKEAEKQVSELFAEAFKRRTIAAGSKDLRRKFAIAEILSNYRRCRESGDYKTAATYFDRYIDLDNLKDNPSLDRAVLVQIVQLIRLEAPSFAPRLNEHLAQFEIEVEQAQAVLSGDIGSSKLLPEPDRTSEKAGIDTGISTNEEASSA